MISSIAHPTDLSAQGMTAFEHALGLALANHCRLDVLHVSRPGEPSDWNAFPRVREVLRRWGLIGADAPVEAITDATGVEVRKAGIQDHDPAGGLLRYLGEHRSQLLVMASHGRAGLDRLLNSSVSAELAQSSLVPTLILGPSSRPFVDPQTGRIDIRRILVPVDHDPDPGEAAFRLEDLAERLGVTLDFVHVGGTAPRLWDRERSQRAVRLLDGPVVETLLAEADGAGLVAMPMVGPRGFLDAVRGSTTEQLVRRAACPVLAIPAPR